METRWAEVHQSLCLPSGPRVLVAQVRVVEAVEEQEGLEESEIGEELAGE